MLPAVTVWASAGIPEAIRSNAKERRLGALPARRPNPRVRGFDDQIASSEQRFARLLHHHVRRDPGAFQNLSTYRSVTGLSVLESIPIRKPDDVGRQSCTRAAHAKDA